MIVRTIALIPKIRIKGPSKLQVPAYGLSGSKYSKQTSREIEQQIAVQKWKQLQNTYKSLNTSFGLEPPKEEDLVKEYPKPPRIDYTIETLRNCSHQYPVYLQKQLKKDHSPFHEVIEKMLENLWKAEQKETLEILNFLYTWKYKGADLVSLYQRVLLQGNLDLNQIFDILLKFGSELQDSIETKILERLRKSQLSPQQYSPLLKIINYLTVKNLLTENFDLAMMRCLRENINKIPPPQILEAYIYYTYNLANDGQPSADLTTEVVSIIEERMFSPECLKFYNAEQLLALIRTFLKNSLVLSYQKQYHEGMVNRVVDRIELMYTAQDFTTQHKVNLLRLSSALPEIKKQLVIALVQNQLLKKPDKFDPELLTELYAISYEEGLLTEELLKKLQAGIIENIFHLTSNSVSRASWLFIVTAAPNTKLLHKKIQNIIEGGLRQYSVKEVSMIVWSMCAANYNPPNNIWESIQSYLQEELQRKYKAQIEGGLQNSCIDLCSWILWAYLNNRELSLKTIHIICQIILQETNEDITSLESAENCKLSVFQLINIVSFFYSVELPFESLISRMKLICRKEFKNLYKTMECIQLCKLLKFMGPEIWSDKVVASELIQMFQMEADSLNYRDIMPVVAVLLNSKIKSTRLQKLIVKLLERKKRMESLENQRTDSS